jgi:hypothetical protein
MGKKVTFEKWGQCGGSAASTIASRYTNRRRAVASSSSKRRQANGNALDIGPLASLVHARGRLQLTHSKGARLNAAQLS